MYYIRSSISKKEALFYLKNGKQSIKEAKSLIPQEVWSDYWNAVMLFKTEKYTKALEACDSFINNPLAYSSQALPQIFTIAIDCCQKEEKDSSFYENKLNELFNELQIDIEKTHLFLY